MKPTHAQLVNLLREIVCAGPQVQPWLIERARQALCLRDAAPATPAVTEEDGETDAAIRRMSHLLELWELAAPNAKLPQSFVLSAEDAIAIHRLIRAARLALAAPPAAGAPPACPQCHATDRVYPLGDGRHRCGACDILWGERKAGAPPALVALDIPTLLQAAKRFGRLAEQFVGPPSRLAQTRRAERDAAVHALRDAEKLLIGLVEKQRVWSPAPAPVAPPAETGHLWKTDGKDLNRCTVCGDGPWGRHRFALWWGPLPCAECSTTDACHKEGPACQRPAPPAVAGGDAPRLYSDGIMRSPEMVVGPPKRRLAGSFHCDGGDGHGDPDNSGLCVACGGVSDGSEVYPPNQAEDARARRRRQEGQ